MVLHNPADSSNGLNLLYTPRAFSSRSQVISYLLTGRSEFALPKAFAIHAIVETAVLCENISALMAGYKRDFSQLPNWVNPILGSIR